MNLASVDASYTDTVNTLMFDWHRFEVDAIRERAETLPRKLIRWLAANHPDNRTRKIFFRMTGVTIGKGVVINCGLIAEDSYQGLITLEDRVSIAANVMLLADAAPNNSLLAHFDYVRDHLIVNKPIVIRNDAWLGAGCTVLPGVCVGEFAIVGAGAVVTKHVPACTIVAGVPAKVVRTIEKPSVLKRIET
jgi:acetyltransferase-like isoleucine patch superfamily enzyme